MLSSTGLAYKDFAGVRIPGSVDGCMRRLVSALLDARDGVEIRGVGDMGFNRRGSSG